MLQTIYYVLYMHVLYTVYSVYFSGGYEVLNLNSSEYEIYKNVDDYFTYETFRVCVLCSLFFCF